MSQITVSPSLSRAAPQPATKLGDWVRDMARDLFDPYRPELHYMRGPGPKWRQKHGQEASLPRPELAAPDALGAGA